MTGVTVKFLRLSVRCYVDGCVRETPTVSAMLPLYFFATRLDSLQLSSSPFSGGDGNDSRTGPLRSVAPAHAVLL